MYGSTGQGARSLLGDMFGFDPLSFVRGPEVYGFSIERTDEGYRVEVPVAGFRPDEINVLVEDRQLTIEGRGERRRFTRSVVLPDEIDVDNIDARVAHGLLTLTLPLYPKKQPRRIEVRVAGQETPSVSGSTTQQETAQSGTTASMPSVSGEMQGDNGRKLQETR